MASMIPPELQQFVDQQVGSGRYHSAVEVVSDGLRLLQARERRLEQLRAEIQPALDELDRGDAIEVDQQGLRAFFDEIMADVDLKRPGRDETSGP